MELPKDWRVVQEPMLVSDGRDAEGYRLQAHWITRLASHNDSLTGIGHTALAAEEDGIRKANERVAAATAACGTPMQKLDHYLASEESPDYRTSFKLVAAVLRDLGAK